MQFKIRAGPAAIAAACACVSSVLFAGSPIPVVAGPLRGNVDANPMLVMNNSGIVASSGEDEDLSGHLGTHRAYRWSTSGITELGNLGTDRFGQTFVTTNAINNASVVVGAATKFSPTGGDQGMRAVRW